MFLLSSNVLIIKLIHRLQFPHISVIYGTYIRCLEESRHIKIYIIRFKKQIQYLQIN
jgi:hypothetical protein